MRSGFTLIEIIIATAIASILAGALLFSYTQSNRTVAYVNDYIDIYNAAILVDMQFTKDVAGAFIPVQAITPKKEMQKKEQGEQKQKAILRDPFICENKDNQVHMFSFVSNNPVRIFWGKKSGYAKPHVVRVVYTLEEDKTAPKDKPRFALYRQEGTDLQLKSYTGKGSTIERYLLADNIKSCALKFLVRIEPEDKENARVTFQTFTDWHVDQGDTDVRAKVKLPYEVSMQLVLWDNEQVRDTAFTFVVAITPGYQQLPETENSPSAQQPVQQNARQNERKELLVTSANAVVENIRSLFGK